MRIAHTLTLSRCDPDYREKRENLIFRAKEDFRERRMTAWVLRRVLSECGVPPSEIEAEIRALPNGISLESVHGRSR